jgi:hypothetical protein
MKALLVLQEGPGAGYSYPLDPFKQPVFTVGRSSECDIALPDQRASRHHGDFRWNGRHWEVVDRGSTNGTYVNGMQVHGPYDLRVGDRITIGETTMVLREFSAPAPTPARQPSPARQRSPTVEGQALRAPAPSVPAARPQPRAEPHPSLVPGEAREAHGAADAHVGVGFWLVQGFVAATVVCLATGALLPWFEVTGKLSQNLGPLQGIADFLAPIVGSDLLQFTQPISGLETYGKLTLGISVICLIVLVADVFFYYKSVVPGIVYMLLGLVATGSMASDLVNFYKMYKQAESLTLLFGIQLKEVVQVLNQLVDIAVTPLPGIVLTVIGLVLLLLVGVGRLAVALSAKPRI